VKGKKAGGEDWNLFFLRDGELGEKEKNPLGRGEETVFFPASAFLAWFQEEKIRSFLRSPPIDLRQATREGKKGKKKLIAIILMSEGGRKKKVFSRKGRSASPPLKCRGRIKGNSNAEGLGEDYRNFPL